MSSPDSTAGPLTVQGLLDLDRDPRHRVLQGMDTVRLLDGKLTAALSAIVDDRQHGQIAALRSAVRRIVATRKAQSTYAQLLQQAV